MGFGQAKVYVYIPFLCAALRSLPGCSETRFVACSFEPRCLPLSRSLTSPVLADIESAGARNLPYAEMMKTLAERAKKFMPLSSDDKSCEKERKRDQYSHFVLRLAFCRS